MFFYEKLPDEKLSGKTGKSWSSAEIVAAIFYDEPSGEPEDADQPRGEWYCDTQETDCPVREVEIRLKLHGEPMPALKCPACGHKLKFHHWLKSHGLVPVDQAEKPRA